VSPPHWLEPLPDAPLMRAIDEWAIQVQGIASLELMERAGDGLARVVAERVPAGPIAVVCGKGNNGGDGFVAARLLRQAGRDVEVLTLWPAHALSEDARAMLARLGGTPPVEYSPARLEHADGIVDALLGTGAAGAPEDPAAGAIEDLNGARGRVVATDIPSGVDASTGEVAGAAVRAVATATFHRAKPGLWIAPGKARCGAVSVIDIGIPPGAPGESDVGLIGAGVLRGVPRRGADSTKFSSGSVVIVGGSRGLSGAPSMSALGAMRAGAGYVILAAPASLQSALAPRLLEAMHVALPEEDGAVSAEAVDAALAATGRADAVVLGPGIGRSAGARELVGALVQRIEVPLVIDADGLNALAGKLGELRHRRWPTVLTPHAGELARLLEVDSAEVGRARLHHARAAAARAQALVVLKGDDSLVAAPSGRVAVSAGGAPALATAGTGDVLAGVTGAMLAKRLSTAHAACAAVYAHLRAGQLAARPHGPDGVIASDVIAELPAALAGAD
jgi:ADP-dependent NAD(P)H-hydrate dehydratase / NAD(P)H-hydrate epimerase